MTISNEKRCDSQTVRRCAAIEPMLGTLGSVHEFLIKMKAETMQRAAKKVFASLS